MLVLQNRPHASHHFVRTLPTAIPTDTARTHEIRQVIHTAPIGKISEARAPLTIVYGPHEAISTRYCARLIHRAGLDADDFGSDESREIIPLLFELPQSLFVLSALRMPADLGQLHRGQAVDLEGSESPALELAI